MFGPEWTCEDGLGLAFCGCSNGGVVVGEGEREVLCWAPLIVVRALVFMMRLSFSVFGLGSCMLPMLLALVPGHARFFIV